MSLGSNLVTSIDRSGDEVYIGHYPESQSNTGGATHYKLSTGEWEVLNSATEGIDTGINLSKLYDLSKYIERVSGIPLPYNKPVVGRNTFMHESELHVMSALEKDKYWMCFTPYRPEVVGQKEKIIFGPTTLHGDAIRMKCEQMGFKSFDTYLDEIKAEVHSVIKKKKFLDEKELENIIKKIIH